MNRSDIDLQSFSSSTEVEKGCSSIHEILRDFEYRITETLKEVVRSTLTSLKCYVESEIAKINGNLNCLHKRIGALERSSERNHQSAENEKAH